eukprot:12343328-Karenia_brevis.AAC.1
MGLGVGFRRSDRIDLSCICIRSCSCCNVLSCVCIRSCPVRPSGGYTHPGPVLRSLVKCLGL